MKYILYAFMAMVLFGCKGESTEVEEEVIEQVQEIDSNSIADSALPCSSVDIEKYYHFDEESSVYSLVYDAKEDLVPFSSENLTFPVKEDGFGFQFKTKKYREAKRFSFSNNISGRLIVYTTSGENDISMLNIQLNTFKNGKLIDQLLLDSKFSWEIRYYNDFVIHKNETIEIDKYTVEYMIFDDSYTGDENDEVTTIEKVVYGIDKNGYFVKKRKL